MMTRGELRELFELSYGPDTWHEPEYDDERSAFIDSFTFNQESESYKLKELTREEQIEELRRLLRKT